MDVGLQIDPGKAVRPLRNNESSAALCGNVIYRLLEDGALVALCVVINQAEVGSEVPSQSGRIHRVFEFGL
jgi:hypothetical protein